MLKIYKNIIEFCVKSALLFIGLAIMFTMALIIGFKKGIDRKYEIKYGDEYDMNDFIELQKIFYPRIKKFNKVEFDYECNLKDRPMFQFFSVKSYTLGMFGERDGFALFQEKPEFTFFIENLIKVTSNIKVWAKIIFIKNMAHEMKHARQYELDHDYAKNYIDNNEDLKAYKDQKIEREARSASHLYVLYDLIFIMRNIF